MNIIVTGSSGTIGTRLVEKLLDKHNLECIDKRNNEWIKSIDNITKIIDLRNIKSTQNLSSSSDYAILLAANARVFNLVNNPNLARDNFEITFNSLEMCRKNDIKNVQRENSQLNSTNS